MFVAILSTAVWFGLSLATQAFAYDLFVTGTSVLREMDVSLQLNTIRVLASMMSTAVWAYGLMIVSVKLVLWMQRKSFRKDGYMVMSFILYGVSVPFGLWYAWKSLEFYWLVGDHYSIAGIHADTVIPAFVLLFTKNAWMNFLSLAGVVAVTAILVFKPLRQTDSH